jgi:hypothetical protein
MIEKELYSIEELELTDTEVEELIENGYAALQMLDGKPFIRLFPIFFSEGAEVACQYPTNFCTELWNTLCEDSTELDPIQFIHMFTSVHRFIIDYTDGHVDFCKEIGNLLDKEFKC